MSLGLQKVIIRLLSICKSNEKLAFEISDNGVGIKDKTHVFGKGIGLTNMRLGLKK